KSRSKIHWMNLIASSTIKSANYRKVRSAHELSAPCSFLRGIFLISRRPWLDRINEPFRIALVQATDPLKMREQKRMISFKFRLLCRDDAAPDCPFSTEFFKHLTRFAII